MFFIKNYAALGTGCQTREMQAGMSVSRLSKLK